MTHVFSTFFGALLLLVLFAALTLLELFWADCTEFRFWFAGVFPWAGLGLFAAFSKSPVVDIQKRKRTKENDIKYFSYSNAKFWQKQKNWSCESRCKFLLNVQSKWLWLGMWQRPRHLGAVASAGLRGSRLLVRRLFDAAVSSLRGDRAGQAGVHQFGKVSTAASGPGGLLLPLRHSVVVRCRPVSTWYPLTRLHYTYYNYSYTD